MPTTVTNKPMVTRKINKNDKIFIAGHLGMVGSAITRGLEKRGYNNLLTRTRKELDLLNQKAVFQSLFVFYEDKLYKSKTSV